MLLLVSLIFFLLLSRIQFGEAQEVACLPLSEAIGLQNNDGIPPVNGRTADQKIIKCYPRNRIVFPTSQSISCTPADVDPFICSPISSADGPPNFYGIPPINCQKIIDSSVVECYPNRVIIFPAQCPDWILCFPIPSAPVGPDPTTVAVTTTTASAGVTTTSLTESTTILTTYESTATPTEVTTEVITTTEALSTTSMTTSTEISTTEAPIICMPLKKGCGAANDQQISPIQCQLDDGSTINCYPPSAITFPQENPAKVECTPVPRTPAVCTPVEEIPGASPNSDGIYPVKCRVSCDGTIISCYPNYLVTFPQQNPTKLNCLSLYDAP